MRDCQLYSIFRNVPRMLFILIFMAVSVIIGLQQSYYSTVEGQGPVDICITVLSGDLNENSFTINYSTTNGLAEGIKFTYPL